MLDAIMALPLSLAFALLCVAHALDVATTARVLALGGRELNPLARWCMAQVQHWGLPQVWGLVLLKAAITAVLALLSVRGLGDARAVALVTAGTAAVALWNWRVARQLERQARSQAGGRT